MRTPSLPAGGWASPAWSALPFQAREITPESDPDIRGWIRWSAGNPRLRTGPIQRTQRCGLCLRLCRLPWSGIVRCPVQVLNASRLTEERNAAGPWRSGKSNAAHAQPCSEMCISSSIECTRAVQSATSDVDLQGRSSRWSIDVEVLLSRGMPPVLGSVTRVTRRRLCSL